VREGVSSAMRHKKRKWFLILTPAAMVALAIGVICAWPAWRRWQTEGMLARYRAAPDVATATKLMKLLRRGEVDEELGGRILGTIYNRVAVVRKSYRPDVQVRFAMETTNPVPNEPRLWPRCREVFSDTEGILAVPWDQLAGQEGPNALDYETLSLSPLYIDEGYDSKPQWVPDGQLYAWRGLRNREGTHRFAATWQVRYREYIPGPSTRASPPNSNPQSRRIAKEYQARINVPVEIRILPKDKAERVLVRSDPALDKAMRAGIRVGPEPPGERTISWFSRDLFGNAQLSGGFSLVAGDLPVGCVFRVRYVDADSAIDGLDGGVLVLRAGAQSRVPFPQLSGELNATRFDGKLVLTPDPGEAAGYPGFESIWGGKLEFPLQFEVSKVHEAQPFVLERFVERAPYWPDGRPKPYPIGPLVIDESP